MLRLSFEKMLRKTVMFKVEARRAATIPVVRMEKFRKVVVLITIPKK